MPPEPTGITLEDFRPKRFEEVVGQASVVRKLEGLVRSYREKKIAFGLIPNLLFSGPPGVGKTTCAQVFADQLEQADGSFDGPIFVAYSTVKEGRGLEFVSTILAQLTGAAGRRVIFVDEADQLAPDAMRALRYVLENRGDCLFILATNKPEGLLESSSSRLVELRFQKPSSPEIRRVLESATARAGRSVDPVVIDRISREAKGDARRAIQDLAVEIATFNPEEPTGTTRIEASVTESSRSEQTKRALADAKSRGAKVGRGRKYEFDLDQAIRLRESGKSWGEIVRELGLPPEARSAVVNRVSAHLSGRGSG